MKGMKSCLSQGREHFNRADYTAGIQHDPAQHGGKRGLDGVHGRGEGKDPTCWVGVYLTVWE